MIMKFVVLVAIVVAAGVGQWKLKPLLDRLEELTGLDVDRQTLRTEAATWANSAASLVGSIRTST